MSRKSKVGPALRLARHIAPRATPLVFTDRSCSPAWMSPAWMAMFEQGGKISTGAIPAATVNDGANT